MNNKIAVVFLAFITVAFGDGVLELTDEDFLSRLVQYDVSLVMFYDPWASYTAYQATELDKASDLLQAMKQDFVLAKVDCIGSGKDTCAKHEIQNIDEYPKMQVFRRGRMGQEYSGPDDAAGIAKFVKVRYGPASTEYFKLDEVKEFVAASEPSILALFEHGSDIETMYLKFAEHYKGDYRLGHSSAPEILSEYKEKNAVLFFRPPQFHNKFEPNYVSYKGDSQQELLALIKENWHGLVGHRTVHNFEDFPSPHVIVYYDVDYVNNVKQTNYWRNRILKVAKDYPEFIFCVSNGDDMRSEIEKFGSGYTGETPFVTAHDKADRKYKMSTAFSVENLNKFMSDMREGKEKPFVKSQKIPKTNDEPVKVTVAANFDEIVTNNGKDTFLEVFAPWCRFCKDLAPTFDELGVKMIGEDIEIVKFDGDSNDVPVAFQLQGFPSLYWLPKNKKDNPILYTGAKNLDSFIKYIAEHATNELNNYDRNGEPKKTEL